MFLDVQEWRRDIVGFDWYSFASRYEVGMHWISAVSLSGFVRLGREFYIRSVVRLLCTSVERSPWFQLMQTLLCFCRIDNFSAIVIYVDFNLGNPIEHCISMRLWAIWVASVSAWTVLVEPIKQLSIWMTLLIGPILRSKRTTLKFCLYRWRVVFVSPLLLINS